MKESNATIFQSNISWFHLCYNAKKIEKEYLMAFNFDTTYTQLGEDFYSYVKPDFGKNPQILLLNDELLQKLDIAKSDWLVDYLSAKKLQAKPYAMAYAGHQFGYFTMLGDGRAAVLGEHITKKNERYDIQLKGSGITPYSRGGDGKAAAVSMVREYIYCNSMDKLGVKTSRALAVITTDTKVYREYLKPAAILVRVMQSHIRVGTFEYAANFLDTNALQSLANYTINRHYNWIETQNERRYIQFFEAVMEAQIDMVINWLRVGFVHGVMNTDNMSITGETFDYGPCAIMNFYDPNATFSSRDKNSRYSFGNQKKILHWNLARFAQSLLPLINEDKQKAAFKMNEILVEFEKIFDEKFYDMMSKKLGIYATDSVHHEMIDRVLHWLEKTGADYTNTFLALMEKLNMQDTTYDDLEFLEIKNALHALGQDTKLMSQNNPTFIPRNYIVEEAIEEYERTASLQKVEKLLEVMQNPYEDNIEFQAYQKPPSKKFEEEYATFCNT